MGLVSSARVTTTFAGRELTAAQHAALAAFRGPPPTTIDEILRGAMLSGSKDRGNSTCSEGRSIRVRQRRFGVLCVLGYVALSWAVRFDLRRGEQISSLIYPLDTFSMYARLPSQDAHHLLVRDEHGAVHPVQDFLAFDCAQPIAGPGVPCSDKHGIEYHYEDLIHYIQNHQGPGQMEAGLIIRSWRVRPGEAPQVEQDCLITHCKVAR